MQELVAGVERIRFDAEADLEQQQGAQLPPFPEQGAAVCKFFTQGLCTRGECSSEDCPFPLVDATAGTMGCPWYDQGFCRHGPLCRYKHTQRVMCANYLAGFCPEGPTCKFMHLKAALMMHSTDPAKGAECPQKPGVARIHCQRGEWLQRCVTCRAPAASHQHHSVPGSAAQRPPQWSPHPTVPTRTRHLLQVQTERSLCWQVWEESNGNPAEETSALTGKAEGRHGEVYNMMEPDRPLGQLLD